jgi:hypothetical protein
MPQRGRSTLFVLLTVAVAVSVVHYTDNYVNYADYPQADEGSAAALVTRSVVLVSWFVFTAFGFAGVWLFVRGRIVPAAACMTAYSVSGLIGVGHYLVPGATDMVWWRQTHVAVDIVCGVLVLAFALWSVVALRPATRPAP